MEAIGIKDNNCGPFFMGDTKAFDSIPHVILYVKYGLDNSSICELFIPYINHRKQIGHIRSERVTTKKGVAQGKRLGP